MATSEIAEILIAGWAQNLAKVDALFKDIDADEITRQPPGIPNHPAWTLSHLIHYHPAIIRLVSAESIEDPALAEGAADYDAGSTPVDRPEIYLPKNRLLEQFRDGHANVALLLETATPEQLKQPPGLARWAKAFGTTQRALFYLMHYHETLHIGQIMIWRRALGKAPLE